MAICISVNCYKESLSDIYCRYNFAWPDALNYFMVLISVTLSVIKCRLTLVCSHHRI